MGEKNKIEKLRLSDGGIKKGSTKWVREDEKSFSKSPKES